MSFQSLYCKYYGLTDSPESIDSISDSKGIASQAKIQRAFYDQTRFPVESWFAMMVPIRSPLYPIGVLALNQRTVDSDYERCYAWHNSDVDLLTDAASILQHSTGGVRRSGYWYIPSLKTNSGSTLADSRGTNVKMLFRFSRTTTSSSTATTARHCHRHPREKAPYSETRLAKQYRL